jgi:hypothetical protein
MTRVMGVMTAALITLLLAASLLAVVRAIAEP